MDQLRDFADNRLINGCIYCNDAADSRDHVPSRTFLEPPYPENLPVVGSCKECNIGFSKDEEYFACLIEVATAESTDPDLIRRPSVAKALRRSAALRARFEAAKTTINGRTAFAVEPERIKNVILKLARGHAAFDLSQTCRHEPDHYWAGSLALMSEELRNAFNEAHEQQMLGEVGSRGLQRMLALETVVQSESGERSVVRLLLNDWVDVQDGYYRYLAIDDVGCIVIRIVIAECLACEIVWRDNANSQEAS